MLAVADGYYHSAEPRLLRRHAQRGGQRTRLSDAGALPLPPGTALAPSAAAPDRIVPAEALPSFDGALDLPALGGVVSALVRALALAAAWALAAVGRSGRSRLAFWPRLASALLFGGLIDTALRKALRIAKRQGALLDPSELATRDSRFATLSGTSVHYIRRLPAQPPAQTGQGARGLEPPRPRFVVHMHHGFGASSLSFLDVLSPLADGLGALALAHDRLGFGLSARPPGGDAYGCRAQASLAQQLLAAAAAEHGCEGAPRVLFGHSLGAQLALDQALAVPGRVAALVLIAPAIGGRSRRAPRVQARGGGALALVRSTLALVSRAARATVLRALRPLVLQLVLGPLRAAAYSPSFWQKGLGEAWLDRSRITPATLARYRRPSLAKDWDVGLLRFARAMSRAEAATQQPPPARPALERAREALAGVPILILHGKQDRIIPRAALVKLAAALGPTAAFVELEECGHVPHEECPERFLDAVLHWLRANAVVPIVAPPQSPPTPASSV